MRPCNPNTLVKPIYHDNDPHEAELDDDSSDDNCDGDSDSSGGEPICQMEFCFTKVYGAVKPKMVVLSIIFCFFRILL